MLIPLLLSSGAAISCDSAKPSPASSMQSGSASYAKPAGWSVAVDGTGAPGGQNLGGFSVGRDTAVFHGGHASGTIRTTSVNAEGWRSLTQAIRADDYRGKRVRLRGFLKAKEVTGFAGLWMRVDAIDRQQEFDNMQSRPITGTTDWTPCSIVLDVPKDAAIIAFGAVMREGRQVWVDDLVLEVVNRLAVPVTGGWLGPDYSQDAESPLNLDLAATPHLDSRLDVPGWQTGTDKWDDSIHLDPKVTRNGKPTATLRNASSERESLALFQEIKATKYRGKRVQFRAYLGTMDKPAGSAMLAIPGGGQWAVSDVPQHDGTVGKSVDGRVWHPFAAVLDVPNWANCIQFGVQLDFPGQVWVSEPSFKIVDPHKARLTDCPPLERLYSNGEVRSLPRAPQNLDFEG